MIRLTIHLYSGRPNPAVQLGDGPAREVLARLQDAPRLPHAVHAPPAGLLGYHGLSVEYADRLGPRCEFAPVQAMPLPPSPGRDDVHSFVLRRLGAFSGPGAALVTPAVTHGRRVTPALPDAPGAALHELPPLYEPSWWNDSGPRQLHNNCYNYAANYRTETFAQPGRSRGATFAELTGAQVAAAAAHDALVPAPHADDKPPREGHLVALVTLPGVDFHWYRLDRDGGWSHKVGPAPVTDKDNAGALISDPRTADRGPYREFVGFMIAKHGHIRLV